MNANFITLTKDNIGKEHICCAFSDKNTGNYLQPVLQWKICYNRLKRSSY